MFRKDIFTDTAIYYIIRICCIIHIKNGPFLNKFIKIKLIVSRMKTVKLSFKSIRYGNGWSMMIPISWDYSFKKWF